MEKMKLFIDFDNTIVDSITAFCETYNRFFKTVEGFSPANPSKVNKWDFSDECPLCSKDSIARIFDHPVFWENLEIFPNAKEKMLELNNFFEIIIVSVGNPKNLSNKALFIDKNLDFVKNVLLIRNDGMKMDKSLINMKGGVLVDDHPSNLNSSNADIKILFGQRYSWNENWDGENAKNWVDLFYKLNPY